MEALMRLKYHGIPSTSLLAVLYFKKFDVFINNMSGGKTHDSSYKKLVGKKLKHNQHNTKWQQRGEPPKNISCNQHSLKSHNASIADLKSSSKCNYNLSESISIFSGNSNELHNLDRKTHAGSSGITSRNMQISKGTVGTECNPHNFIPEPCNTTMIESEKIRFCKIAESCVVELLNQKEYEKCFNSVVEFVKNKQCPSFKTLHRIAAYAGTRGNVMCLNYMKSVAEKVYQKQYIKKLYFNHYLVNALFKSERTKDALDLIEELYKKHPKNTKKIKDMTKFLINDVFTRNDEELENQVMNFVIHVAQTLNQVTPAIDYWRAAFCSSNHNHHLRATYLLKEVPDLHHLIEQKLESIINSARKSGSPDVLQRLVQLSLELNLMELCEEATGALLLVHCETGDLKLAGETIKFAQQLKFVLKAKDIQCFLGLLNQHKKQAPLSLLAMKYAKPKQSQLPPAKVVSNAPEIQFKW